MGQSIVLSEIKTEVPLENDDPTNKDLLLQQHGERIERLSQQDRLSKICMDAGFLSVVEIGQYFMTKDTGEQFHTVACREYTLPREDGSSQPRMDPGKQKLDPCWKSRPVACMLNTELKSEFGLWVKTTLNPGLQILMDQVNLWWIRTTIQKFLKISLKNKRYNWMWRILHTDQRQKQKPQRKEPTDSSSGTIPMNARNWIETEPGKHFLSAYEVSKKVIHLLRHCQQVHREEDGAVHFWRIKENLRNQFSQIPHWSDDRWKECLAAGGAKKTIPVLYWWFRNNCYFRSLQGHSGRNLIDPSLQDNVVIQGEFFQYIYHIGSAFNLHSITNSGLIPGGQNSSKRQTVFFFACWT